jgi:hypothetical protein
MAAPQTPTNSYNFPNTNTTVNPAATNSGLSTQIVIKVDGNPVGAVQTLDVEQTRPLKTVVEIGTDGIVELVPNAATTFSIRVTRIVFDQLRLPEAFARGFRFIQSQRLPFEIEIYDTSNAASFNANDTTGGVVVMKFVGCWFASMSTPYAAGDYLITEQATIQCESAYVSTNNTPVLVRVPQDNIQFDDVELAANSGQGGRRGSLDVSGLLNATFGSTTNP